MKDNLHLDTETAKKKSTRTKLIDKVPEIEFDNRLNVQ